MSDGTVKARALAWFVPAVAALALASFVAIYAWGWASPPIRSDGWSYYAYLPSTLIFGDPSLGALARDCCGGTFPTWTAIDRVPGTGEWLSAHPIGEAVLLLPFFLAADALTWWSNLPRDGFSPYYQYAAGLGGVCYLVAGLWLLRRVLLRTFSAGVVLATLVCVTFGTDLFHYGTFDATYSHVFSFCLCAAMLEVWPRWLERPSIRASILAGSLAGVIVLVRHTNVLLPLGMMLYGVTNRQSLAARVAWITDRWSAVATAAGVAAIWLLPQLLLYHHATGEWLTSPYGPGRRFQFASPHIAGVLVGPAKGLFFWSPVLLASVAGMAVLRRRAPAVIAPLAVILPIQVYLVASWFDWQFGSSFGHRAFADLLPLLAMPMAAAFAAATGTRFAVPVGVIAGLMVALSVAQMLQYWIGVLPQSDTTWQMYRDTFLRFGR